MEDHQPLSSLGDSLRRCCSPLCAKEPSEDEVLQDDQGEDLIDIKVEVVEEEEEEDEEEAEMYLMADQQ
ncbi:hypothetical protein GDO81_018319, partial [Engystomops pustulosus]